MPVRAFPLLCCCAVLLAGCGDDDDQQARSPAAADPGSASRPAAPNTQPVPVAPEASAEQLERAQDVLVGQPRLRLTARPAGPGTVRVTVRYRTPTRARVTVGARSRSGGTPQARTITVTGTAERTVTLTGLPAGAAEVRGQLINPDDQMQARPVTVTVG